MDALFLVAVCAALFNLGSAAGSGTEGPRASVSQDQAGNLHISSMTNQSIFFNGRDILAEMEAFARDNAMMRADIESLRQAVNTTKPTMYNCMDANVLRGHTDHVNDVTIFGNWLFSSSSDHSIRMWDMATSPPRFMHTLNDHTDRVYSMVVLPGRLYSASSDQTVKIWDLTVSPPVTLRTLSLCCIGATVIAVGGDRLYAGGGGQHQIVVYDLASSPPSELHQLMGHKWSVSALATDETAKRLYSASWDQTIRIWDLTKSPPTVLHILAGHTDRVWDMILHGNRMFSSSSDNTIRVWDLTVSPPLSIHTLTWHTQAVRSLAIANNMLYSGSLDMTIRVWNLTVPPPTRVHVLTGHTGPVYGLAVADGHLCSASEDLTVRVWPTDCRM